MLSRREGELRHVVCGGREFAVEPVPGRGGGRLMDETGKGLRAPDAARRTAEVGSAVTDYDFARGCTDDVPCVGAVADVQWQLKLKVATVLRGAHDARRWIAGRRRVEREARKRFAKTVNCFAINFECAGVEEDTEALDPHEVGQVVVRVAGDDEKSLQFVGKAQDEESGRVENGVRPTGREDASGAEL